MPLSTTWPDCSKHPAECPALGVYMSKVSFLRAAPITDACFGDDVTTGQEIPCHAFSLTYQANRFTEIPALSLGSAFP